MIRLPKAARAVAAAILITVCGAFAQDFPKPVHTGIHGLIPQRFDTYDVILEPDKNEPEWWAGAPSVVRGDDGVFWLAARMRSPDQPRGLRGYEIRILRSDDGIHFTKALSIHRDDVPIPGFERPALVIDPASRKFKLYACGPWQNGPWSIVKFADAESPDSIDPKSAHPVIQAPAREYDRDVRVHEFKDPVIIQAGGKYHAYMIGYVRQNERIYHYESVDGESWSPAGEPYAAVMDLTGWHDFFVRPSSILPVGAGYLFVYEGSSTTWRDPVYNIATGIAFTFDLHTITDLTPGEPLVFSTTPSEHFITWRYSTWLHVNDEIWVYAEVTRPNQSHEIRLFRLEP